MNERSERIEVNRLVRRFDRANELRDELDAEMYAACKYVGEKMRLYRQSKGLSVRKLAKKMGISAAHLSDMENGKKKYLTSHLCIAATILTSKTLRTVDDEATISKMEPLQQKVNYGKC